MMGRGRDPRAELIAYLADCQREAYKADPGNHEYGATMGTVLHAFTRNPGAWPGGAILKLVGKLAREGVVVRRGGCVWLTPEAFAAHESERAGTG